MLISLNDLFPVHRSQSWFAHRSDIGAPWIGVSVTRTSPPNSDGEVVGFGDGNVILALSLDEAAAIGRDLLALAGKKAETSHGSWDAAYARAEDDGPVDLDWYCDEVLPLEYLPSGLPTAATY
jgi:hypothetical protein